MLPRKLFHDRTIVLLSFLAVLISIYNILVVLIKTRTTESTTIIRYDAALGYAGNVSAESWQLYFFAVAAASIVVIGLILAVRSFELKRSISVMTLSFTIASLLFNLAVSNALLAIQ